MKTNTPKADPRGWVLYDGECGLCIRLAGRFGPLLGRLGFGLAPLQEPWVQDRLGLTGGGPLMEMGLITRNGLVLGGADAFIHLSGCVWWGRPLHWLSRLPGARALLWKLYRWIAANRHCLGGACKTSRRASWPGWLPLAILLSAAFTLRNLLPAWGFMWALCFALFFGCKWLTWWRAGTEGGWRAVGYLFAWLGMDARTFFSRTADVSRPPVREWAAALSKTLLGTALLWGVTPRIPAPDVLLAGWTGMIGVILLLHFGIFHLLALAWRRAGVDARPIMRSPILSTSLSEFWSVRWNLAFRQLCRDLVFRPALGRLGLAGATLAVFAVSGLIHELVISIPARRGYGLPTAYFLLQGFGILFEHSKAGKKIGVQDGIRGRGFTVLFTAGPACGLFHPPFIEHVIVPFLKTIHALGGGVSS